MSSSWQQFSVEDFFSQCNWSGNPQNQFNTPDVLNEVSWLCQKIEDFFSRSNWSGELQTAISHPVFSLNLTVEGFFQIFDWESKGKIAPLPQVANKPEFGSGANSQELKLDDFTNLF